MNSPVKKLVALDIGGVCISIHLERIMTRFGLKDLQSVPKKFRAADYALETGRMSDDAWWDWLIKATGNRYSRNELAEIWNSVLGPSIPGMADAVRRAVARGWRFAFFSNTSKLHMDCFLSTNDFCHLVTGAVFSYEAHSMKPEPEIYEVFERRYGVPEFYFDDNADNIAAGTARGWNSVRFHSPDQLDALLGE